MGFGARNEPAHATDTEDVATEDVALLLCSMNDLGCPVEIKTRVA